MSGISGFFGLPADKQLLLTMHSIQAHGAPDDYVLFTDNLVGLIESHPATSSETARPTSLEHHAGRYAFAWDGAVFNHQQIAGELEQVVPGYHLTTLTATGTAATGTAPSNVAPTTGSTPASPAASNAAPANTTPAPSNVAPPAASPSNPALVVAAYESFGAQCFDKFNGMWALAIYDKEAQRLVLSRDHFGIKPLYYARVGNGLVFSTDIRPILDSGLIKKKPNDRVLYRYLRFRVHDNSKETFFAGIEKLLPGEMLVVDSGGIVTQSYTELRSELSRLAKLELPYDEQAQARYLEGLTDSVRQRLQGGGLVGTPLSGGLDSSAVAILISRLAREGKSGVAEAREGESGVAEARTAASLTPVADAPPPEAPVADVPPPMAISPQHVFSAVFPGSINDEEKFVDIAAAACGDQLVAHKVQPSADQFKLDIVDFIRAQEEPTISTGPYAQFTVMREAAQFVQVAIGGQGADETMAGYVPYYFVYLRALLRQGRYLRWLVESLTSLDVLLRLVRFRLADRLRFRKSIALGPLLSPEFREQYFDERFSTVRDDLKERLLEDVFENSIPSLLRYEGKNGNYFGLQGRMPFLDKHLVSQVFTLSDEAIIKHGWNKRIMRDSLQGILPNPIARRRNKIGFTTPEHEWFIRLKNYFYDIFMSSKFASRPYFNQDEVVKAFEAFIQGKTSADTMTFWRLINTELWLREYFDGPEPPPKVKLSDFEPNLEKQLDIVVGEQTYRRYPIRTEIVSAETNLDGFVTNYVDKFFAELPKQDASHLAATQGRFFLFISEKIVAITQGRSYFIWDIQTGFWAKLLSRFVTRSPAGIGLGSPFTMQLAIQEVGLPRILYASIGGMVGKLIGRRGLFYTLAGNDINAIDGPTEYSVYPANVSAKLAPKDPDQVAARLTERIREVLPVEYQERFAGVVVIDANDIGQNVLGTNGIDDPHLYEQLFSDNPQGQAHQQTPISLVFEG